MVELLVKICIRQVIAKQKLMIYETLAFALN